MAPPERVQRTWYAGVERQGASPAASAASTEVPEEEQFLERELLRLAMKRISFWGPNSRTPELPNSELRSQTPRLRTQAKPSDECCRWLRLQSLSTDLSQVPTGFLLLPGLAMGQERPLEVRRVCQNPSRSLAISTSESGLLMVPASAYLPQARSAPGFVEHGCKPNSAFSHFSSQPEAGTL